VRVGAALKGAPEHERSNRRAVRPPERPSAFLLLTGRKQLFTFGYRISSGVPMGIGVGIVLAALGAILAFAVNAEVSGLDLSVVGWVLMAAGALGVLIEVAVFAPRRRLATYETPVAGPTVVRRSVL
jgi:hypothetical protein